MLHPLRLCRAIVERGPDSGVLVLGAGVEGLPVHRFPLHLIVNFTNLVIHASKPDFHNLAKICDCVLDFGYLVPEVHLVVIGDLFLGDRRRFGDRVGRFLEAADTFHA